MRFAGAVTRLTTAMLLLAAASGASAVSVQSASAATSTMTVNLGSSTGSVLHGANGALYGLSDAGVPSDNLLTPLAVTTIAQKAPGGTQHPNGDAAKVSGTFVKDSSNGKILIYMQDYYPDWPYATTTLSSYLSVVDTIAAAVVASPQHSSFEYVPVNEPDGIWFGLGVSSTSTYDTNRDTFFTWWDAIYAEIKKDDPSAKIVGPNEANFDTRFLPDFLAHAKSAGTLPSMMSWHELSSSSTANFASHYSTYRAEETAAGVSALPIDITEYGDRRDLSVPGQLVQWISAFENAKVYGDMAYWDIAGNFDDLTTGQNTPTGAYWLYDWYARMSGNTVSVTPPSPNTTDTLQGVASYDTGKDQAQVILGGSSGAANVVVNGVSSSVFGSNVAATVEETDWSGYAGAGAAPQVISRAVYSTSSGSITVPLTGLKAMSAYRIVLTPSNVTTPTAADAPYSASYEAESAAITGGTVYTQGTVSNANGYATSGTQDVGSLNTSTSAVTFTVTAPTTGSYDLGIYYGNQGGSYAQQALSVDGTASQLVNYPATLSWLWRSRKDVTLALSAGAHTITLAKYNATLGTAIGEVTLDKIDLTAVSSAATVYESALSRTSGTVSYNYTVSDGTGEGRAVLASGASSTADVYAPSDGFYTTTVRYATSGSLTLTANGNTVTGGTLASTSGAMSTATVSLYLQAGLNPVTVTANGAASVENVTVAATGSTSGVTTYQAESSANTLGGTAVVTANTWASGGSYVGYIGNGSANTLTFNGVTAAHAGTYMLAIQYSNDDTSGSGNYNSNIESRTASISVNGGTATTEVFANTFSWDQFNTVDIPVTLAAGSNTITFSNASAYVPNIDSIRIAAQ